MEQLPRQETFEKLDIELSDGRKFGVVVSSVELIGGGAEGAVYRIVGTNSETNEPISFAYKVLTRPQDYNFKQVLAVHRKAAESGVPTYDFFGATENGFVMDDLTEDGQAMVLSDNDLVESRPHLFFTPQKRGIKEVFSEVDLSGLDNMAVELAESSARAGIDISHSDCIFFTIGMDGRYRLMLGDFGHLQLSDNVSARDNLSQIRGIKPMLRSWQRYDEDDDNDAGGIMGLLGRR